MRCRRIVSPVSLASLALLSVGCHSAPEAQGTAPAELAYPTTRTVDARDTRHGGNLADPYRWLEADVREDAEVAAWVAEQRDLTADYLATLPHREAFRERLSELWDFGWMGLPREVRGRYVFEANDGDTPQPVLYVGSRPGERERVLLDPNTWSAEGTVSYGGGEFSRDGRYLAYARRAGGSDWNTWHVVDVDTGEHLDDTLEWIKWSGVSWAHDGSGFYYAGFPAPAAGETFTAANTGQEVRFHRLGTPQSEDRVIYANAEHPDWTYGAQVSDNGHYLMLKVWRAGAKNHVLALDLRREDAAPRELVEPFAHRWSYLGSDGPWLIFETDFDAPNGRVVKIDARSGSWETVVPEADLPVDEAARYRDLLVVRHFEDVLGRVSLYSLRGEFLRQLELPGVGSVSGLRGDADSAEGFLAFESFNRPRSVYRVDLDADNSELEEVFRPDLDLDPEQYEVRQFFATSPDGTRVPYFLTQKRGLEWDGERPVVLYGYGGFNIALEPRFSVPVLAWIEAGGVHVQANLRGGAEYGAEWHRAGTQLQKQNVFDDFYAVAEHLIEQGVTRPGKLAAHGHSNGGLLVGVALEQRPDLFGAAVPEVGVHDMLRFNRFTAGRYWTEDYGDPDVPEQHAALAAYSPLHNVRADADYPPTLVMTADTDDRVVPGHSFKFAATLQAAGHFALLRVTSAAGHGAGKSRDQQQTEATDRLAFLAEHLGL